MHQLMEKAAIQNLGMDYSVMTRLLEQLRQCQLPIVQPRSSASTLHVPLCTAEGPFGRLCEGYRNSSQIC